MDDAQWYANDEDERQFNLPGFLIGQMFGPGGGQQYGPPGNHPGHHPGGGYPGYGGGPGHGGPGPQNPSDQNNPPSAPPPPFTPEQPIQTFAIDSGAIRNCRFRFTYIWMRREAFWFYPTFIGRNSIAGFRWHRHRWVYYGVDLNQIQSFQCF
jgi:hypothetical protein